MNTATLLPTSSATARPQRGALAVNDTALPDLPVDDDFAVTLAVNLDVDAEPPTPDLPPTSPGLPQTEAQDASDVTQALDPQSAFALAALGLLAAPVPVSQPAPTATPVPVASDASAPLAEPAQPPVAAMAVPLPLPLPAERPREAAPPPAQPLSTGVSVAMPTAVATAAEPAPEITDALGTPEVSDASDALEASATPKPAERGLAAVELGAAPAAAPLRPVAAPAMPQPVVALKGEAPQWQQPLLQALGDRLQLQIAARSDQAVIRLEPPMLGRVEIAIRQQAGELQVRIEASHDEVARQIQQISEPLRQGLVQRHVGDVSVQVVAQGAAGREAEPRGSAQQQAARDGQQQARQEQQQQRRPGRGLDGGEAASFAADLAAMKS